MLFTRVWLALGLVALLAACGRPASDARRSAPTAAAGRAAIVSRPTPTASPTRAPSPTVAAAPQPAATLPATALPATAAAHPTATPSATATAYPTPTPSPTASPSATATPRVVVTAPLVNVRAGPGLTHPVIGQATAGAAFAVSGRTADALPWYNICCLAGGQAGWLRGDLLALDPAGVTIAAAQVVPPPPPPPPTAAPATPRPVAAAGLAPLSAPPPPAGAAPAVNPFTGLGGGNLDRRPVFVCINNDPIARPQYGLGQADLVYEYLMEGSWITRYTALFWSQEVGRIGPVRSARLINAQMTPLYAAALFCSGASAEVRFMLKHQVHFPYLDVDLDDGSNTAYSFNVGADYRTRLYTSSALLEKYVRTWNVNAIPASRGLRFGDYGGGTPASRVDVPYPGSSRAGWAWNGGQWARLTSAGAAYLDAGSAAQITADNVVIQWVEHQPTDIVEDSLGSTSIRIMLIGSGSVKVLRDGKIIEGVWRANDPNQPPEFFDATGAAILLRPGRTWFQIVDLHYRVEIR
jgi:uncharacterized protein YraI